MDIVVRFFAIYRERAACNSHELALPESATVADMTIEIRKIFPRLAPPEVKIVVAVNADYAEPDVLLHQGDDVCLIPPVSGG